MSVNGIRKQKGLIFYAMRKMQEKNGNRFLQ